MCFSNYFICPAGPAQLALQRVDHWLGVGVGGGGGGGVVVVVVVVVAIFFY